MAECSRCHEDTLDPQWAPWGVCPPCVRAGRVAQGKPASLYDSPGAAEKVAAILTGRRVA
jgi:hypothetical protein